MSLQSWQETLVAQTAAGTALNTFTTPVSLLPAQALFTFPAGFFTVGRLVRITATGSISNIVTTPGNIVFQAMLGAVIAFTTGNLPLSTTAHTTLPFFLSVLLTCRSVGSGTSATLLGQGTLISQCVARTAVADEAYTSAALTVPQTAPAVGTGFDSTAAQQLDLFGGFTISDVGNQLQVHQYLVESLN